MLKLSWHIGDVIRKLRKTYGLNQKDAKRANTVSSIELGRNFEQASVIEAAEWLSEALLKKGVIDAPLTVEDLNALVPVPRNEVSRSQPFDQATVDVARMFQNLSVGGRMAARMFVESAVVADQHGGFDHAGSAISTTER